MNPVGRDGKVMSCVGCGSLKHFFMACDSPTKHEYREKRRKALELMKNQGGRRYQNAAYVMFHNELAGLAQSYNIHEHERPEGAGAVGGHTSTPEPETQELAEEGESSSSEEVEDQAGKNVTFHGVDDNENFWLDHMSANEKFYVDETTFQSNSAELATICAPNPDVAVFRTRRH